jgi:DNA-binding FadR family transcriptional regulator
MEYKQIQTGRLSDLVSGQLKESIFQGDYQPGEKIPPEHQLVEIFGVSRIIVREAIRNLEQSGLIEIKRGPNGGAFVLPMNHEAVSQVMKDILRMGKTRASDIMEVRLEIVPIVAGLAAERVTEEDIQMLAQALEDEPKGAGTEHVEWNLNFDRVLAKCTHNPLYEILVNILMDFVRDLILRVKPPDQIIHDDTSHPAIFDKVCKRDAKGAKRLMRSHLEEMLELLKNLEEEIMARPVTG